MAFQEWTKNQPASDEHVGCWFTQAVGLIQDVGSIKGSFRADVTWAAAAEDVLRRVDRRVQRSEGMSSRRAMVGPAS